MVNIAYDLVATTLCKITVVASNNGGASYSIYPTALSGDVGDQIAAGVGKQIIWTPATDNIETGGNYRIKLIARGNPVQSPTQFTSFIKVDGGTFINNTSDVMLSSF